eukprot:5818631-Amphidinium_carterae.2
MESMFDILWLSTFCSAHTAFNPQGLSLHVMQELARWALQVWGKQTFRSSLVGSLSSPVAFLPVGFSILVDQGRWWKATCRPMRTASQL